LGADPYRDWISILLAGIFGSFHSSYRPSTASAFKSRKIEDSGENSIACLARAYPSGRPCDEIP